MAEQDEHLIQVRGLRNSFGEQVIHDGLDLDVRKGEILGVVGGSGTGKSVLMRTIIGLQTPMRARLPCSVNRPSGVRRPRRSMCASAGACCSRAARCFRH
ncbi:hypothetical protein GCM10020258_08480 [Sphingomonas yabuuchiae]